MSRGGSGPLLQFEEGVVEDHSDLKRGTRKKEDRTESEESETSQKKARKIRLSSQAGARRGEGEAKLRPLRRSQYLFFSNLKD